MKRLFGFGKKKKHKKKLSPSAQNAESLRASHPLFQYARNEYAQTVASGTSNDDGRGVLFVADERSRKRDPVNDSSFALSSAAAPAAAPIQESILEDTLIQHQEEDEEQSVAAVEAMASFTSHHDQATAASVSVSVSSPTPSSSHSISMNTPVKTSASSSLIIQQPQQPQQQHPSTPTPEDNTDSSNIHPSFSNISFRSTASTPVAVSSNPTLGTATVTTVDNHTQSATSLLSPAATAAASATAAAQSQHYEPRGLLSVRPSESFYSQLGSPSYNNNNHNNNHHPNESSVSNTTASSTSASNLRQRTAHVEPVMPDSTYEEEYGDAYIGGPIKYVYPSGYQSMRPRSGPWKLSIVVCLLFTWLSVFIVGHCSDRVDYNQYYQYEIDDDIVVIETRWCGSRVLYMMWVISMLVTGLAAAYCSVIGYIKMRDFAVANGRSQPPGMMVGKSDFYVQVDDTHHVSSIHNHHHHHHQQGDMSQYSNNSGSCHVPIYQADGTPQFWGGHIYRPTQAAVAITSR